MKHGLQCGCGPHAYSSTPEVTWVNIDVEPSHNPDIVLSCLDMSKVFGENAFDFIMTVHMVEHLPLNENGIPVFFQEARKVLKEGGTMRIVVPDLGKVARDYVSGSDMKHIFDGPYFEYRDCPATRFLFWARAFEHTVLFDEQLLRIFADEAGFRNFRVMQPYQSSIPELRNKDRFLSESIICEMDK